MTAEEQRAIENYAIATPLKDVDDPDMLAFLATLIDSHDFLRHKLMTEPNRAKRREKLEKLRCHLSFTALSCDAYELAENVKRCGVQPIYQQQEDVKRLVMPVSRIHEI